MAEVDDDQLAALRRLRAAFGLVEVIEVISHDLAAAPAEGPTKVTIRAVNLEWTAHKRFAKPLVTPGSLQ